MSVLERVRTMDKRLRVVAISTAILVVPLIGQILSFAKTSGQLAIFFRLVGVFTIPTSLILTVAVLASIRREWRLHQLIVLLGTVNTVTSLGLVWFFFTA